MRHRGIILGTVLCLLAAAYVYFFSDWFSSRDIHIIPQIRPQQAPIAASDSPDAPQWTYPIIFGFDRKYELTSVKVCVADEFSKDERATPVWQLRSDSNSLPVKAIRYGQNVPGMKPSPGMEQAAPLKPELSYVLVVEAGGYHGSHEFQVRSPGSQGH